MLISGWTRKNKIKIREITICNYTTVVSLCNMESVLLQIHNKFFFCLLCYSCANKCFLKHYQLFQNNPTNFYCQEKLNHILLLYKYSQNFIPGLHMVLHAEERKFVSFQKKKKKKKKKEIKKN